ncbi:MAG: electron transport complex subunit RsxC [Candidatus Nitricoxidivorans perseverans]|uniref:Ion-translocating oxidoreductase complex subunit C n=1 Tax=Candidatus Nitricoxidivorans perseverans TaxID=2975601 RepID=A0AA49FLA3_9PROT|nr:MAG: electron transport complex subunit RsxC [Candidatus Nitricoxidivorans perseverans]
MGLIERILHRSAPPKWGVHPDDRKRPAADAPLRTLPMPPRLYVPLLQHAGQPARPIVLVGQKVLKGQLIAEPRGKVSAPIHAPTSGIVAAIGEITAPHPSGLPFHAITLESDGADKAADADVPADPFALSPEEITERVAAAGVVGLGGATFPSSVKLALGKRTAVATLIVNGGECEPYLSCDDRVMRDFAAGVIDGVRLMMHAIGAREALVGIEDNKPESIAAMRKAAAPFSEIRVRPVPSRYPMGSDRQLIETLTGKEVPADCRAADVGVIVNNVSTANAVHRAIRLGEPLIRRIVTMNGGAVWQPGNILAPVGTLASDLLAFAGLKSEPARLLMGGPMMGAVLPHSRVPIVKGTAGILALAEGEIATPDASPCVRCGNCIRACPIGLLPLEMVARVRVDDLSGAEAIGLGDCISCGCCAYICPSRIPLVQYFTHAKGELRARERARLKMDATRRLAAARIERQEREAREKAAAAARRKAERAAQKAAA